jgi:hypothetical protein
MAKALATESGLNFLAGKPNITCRLPFIINIFFIS